MRYYLVTEEWNYPTSTGREFLVDMDTLADAKGFARRKTKAERHNFQRQCGTAVGPVELKSKTDNSCAGFILYSRDGGAELYYACRIIAVSALSSPKATAYMPRKEE